MSLQKAAASGNRLKALTELRDLLAVRLDKCKSDRDIAAMSRQFVQVTAEIEELKKQDAGKTVSLDSFRGKLKVAK